jgi:hypothetical protein
MRSRSPFVNPSWPAWFQQLVTDYEFHYPPSDLGSDPVVCWHSRPATGYVWVPNVTVILGSRRPLPEDQILENEAAGEKRGESGGEALSEEGNAEPELPEVLFEYLLSDLMREQYYVEPMDWPQSRFYRRPLARLTKKVKRAVFGIELPDGSVF